MKRLIAMCLAAMIMLAGCSSGETAEEATRNALNAVKIADTGTMTRYFGTDFINEPDEEVKSQALTAAFFKNFAYEIISVEGKGNAATARLKLTNTDMEKLMGGLLEEMLTEVFSTAFLPEDQQPTPEETNAKFETMLMEALENADAETVTAEVEVSLEKKDDIWIIVASDEFIDAAMGGMMSVTEAMSELGNADIEP